eukprot:TRINITY_DN24014_c0_g3_i1.p1 TRINITY_DN24014_c0_g3~~TRINITY_DN24014_c0_g3_i1.p1  ORF type:complete len:413 (+),score=82.71 TRINITY_DN24014_c0_g3_i1:71-1309(+)
MDILHGQSNHATFAPLSHAQTVSICRHLQEQIDALMARNRAFERDQADHANSVQAAHDNLTALDVDQNFKDQKTEYQELSEDNRKEIGRTNAALQKLQAGLEQSNENLLVLREAHKVSNVNMRSIAQDVASNAAAATNLREILEKKVVVDIETLRDELCKTNMLVQNLQGENELCKGALQAHKEEHRKIRADALTMRNDLVKTDTRVTLLDQRSGEIARSLRETRQGLEDTTAVVVRLREDVDNTKANVLDLIAGLKKVAAQARQGLDSTERHTAELQSVEGQLGNVTSMAESNRQGLEQAKLSCRALREGQERHGKLQHQIQGELDQLRSMVNTTSRTLMQTNGLVLPNLTMETGGGNASAAGEAVRNALGMPSPPMTPLKAGPPGGAGRGAQFKKAGAGPGTPLDKMAWT